MKVLGIDPASEITGGAIVCGKSLEKTMLWRKTPRQSHPWNLHRCMMKVKQWCETEQPDIACIESLSVTRSAKTTRVIAFYQAACVLGCKLAGVPVVEAKTTTARRIALGDGSLDKESANKLIRKMFPMYQFKRFDAGGGDETDAVVLGLAGSDVAEG